LRKLFEYLKKDKIQRLIYMIGLVLWIILWFDELKYMSENNSYGFYVWSVLIPIPLLILQIIFNKKSLWYLLFIYSILYSLDILWSIIVKDIIIDSSRDFSPQPFWRFEKILRWLIIFIVIFVTNWTITRIKPEKKSNTNENLK
jgi:hypothetical protein